MSATPYIKDHNVVRIGGSLYISIPKDWLKALEEHGLKEDDIEKLLVVADKDIRIVNPEHREEVYKEVTKIVNKGNP